MATTANTAPAGRLAKCPTGIQGLDEITGGGLPRSRPTLVCGGPGSGKTLLGIEFLVRGAVQFDEPGVLMAFEETGDELSQNVRSLGFDLDQLAEEQKLVVDHVKVDRSEIAEAGEYDLEALFIRLGLAIDSVGAKRVVLDTLETLFGGFSDLTILRAELRRLFHWIKQKGVTAVITAERGEGTLTRQGLEEYVSDCVIMLDHRVNEQVATRRMRIVKYRGSGHGTNEYPFIIDERGIEVLPLTSLCLCHQVSEERIPTGIAELDAMLGGNGVYRGSSILVSGTAGTGKSSVAALFAQAACQRGDRCLYFAFEESPSQIMRNMRSIGIHLETLSNQGLLQIHAIRPTACGLETHLASMHRSLREFKPHMVVVDPISNLIAAGTLAESKSMLMRLVDHLKSEQITALMTNLAQPGGALEETEIGISSLVDTWLLLRDIEREGERNRGLFVLKSRGMAHSNQVREFLLTDQGVQLVDVSLGPEGMLTGSARLAQEARERDRALQKSQETAARKRASERRQRALEAQIATLRDELETEQEAASALQIEENARMNRQAEDLSAMGRSRKANQGNPEENANKQHGGRQR